MMYIEIRHTEWVRMHLYRMWQLTDVAGVMTLLADRMVEAYWGSLSFIDSPEYSMERWYGE